MIDGLDFNSFATLPSGGDNRMATWAWTGLSKLNSSGCATCSGINFGGELFTGTVPSRTTTQKTRSEMGYSLPRKSGRYRWVTNAAPPD